jgi:putative ABC transport system ATP-binding protein
MGLLSGGQRQALELGGRTVMLHEGRAVLDVADEERAGLGPADLVALFAEVRGQELDGDSLLLS